jgi:hypothetical protein
MDVQARTDRFQDEDQAARKKAQEVWICWPQRRRQLGICRMALSGRRNRAALAAAQAALLDSRRRQTQRVVEAVVLFRRLRRAGHHRAVISTRCVVGRLGRITVLDYEPKSPKPPKTSATTHGHQPFGGAASQIRP